MEKLTRWDATRNLETDANLAAYLEAAIEDGDGETVIETIHDVARAIGMREIARRMGISRERLYEALDQLGKPDMVIVARLRSVLDVPAKTTGQSAAE